MFFKRHLPTLLLTLNHREHTRFLSFFVVLFLVLGGVAGCIDLGFGDDDDDEDTLVVAVSALPETLDPAIAYDPISLFVVGNVYETLVSYDEESVYEVVSGIASSWAIENLYQTYTFYLKGDIKFSNGNPLTAEDVEYSLARAIEMDQEPSWMLSQVIDTSNISIGSFNPHVDDVEDIRISLKYPYRSFLNILAFPVASIVDKETVELHGGYDKGQDTSWLATNTVGSGPYTKNSMKSDKMTLKKNRHFHEKWEKKFVENVELKVYQSESQKLDALEDEKVDVAALSLFSFDDAKTITSLTIQEIESLRIGFIGFNTRVVPFNNTEIRQALSMMLDFSSMVNDVLKSHGTREATLFPSEFDIPLTQNPPSYNPVEALDIFEKYYTVSEGQVEGFPTITATYPAGNYLLEKTLTIYQETLADIGITLELNPLNSTAYLTALRNGDTELFGMEWEPDYADPDAYAYPLLHSASTDRGNFAFYQNASLDVKIEEAKETFNPDARNNHYAEIAGISLEEMPYLWLYSAKNLYISQNYVVGITFNPIIQMDLYGVNLVK